MNPRIGITCNRKDSDQTVSMAYVRAVARAGAVPLLLPVYPNPHLWRPMLQSVDGLLLSGGGDPDARHFGEEAKPTQGEVQPDRDRMELFLAKTAMEEKIPVLGICRGAQVMTIAAGGTLHQDIADFQRVQHDQRAPKTNPIHRVTVAKESLLFQVIQKETILVNSMHHQAVKSAGMLQISAVAADDITEAVELPNHPFALGIQWHPEWLSGQFPHARALFIALAKASCK